MLQPFWVTLQELSVQVPDSVQLPWAFTHVPLPPPLLLELQAGTKESQAAAKISPLNRIVSSSRCLRSSCSGP